MNNERRQAVRIISHLLDTLVTELNDLADAEAAAFGKRPPGFQQSVSGDQSKSAYDELSNAADKISNTAAELNNLAS